MNFALQLDVNLARSAKGGLQKASYLASCIVRTEIRLRLLSHEKYDFENNTDITVTIYPPPLPTYL